MALITKDDLPVVAYAAATLALRLVPRGLRFRWSNNLARWLGALWYRLDRQSAILTRESLRFVLGSHLTPAQVEKTGRKVFQNIVLGKIVNDILTGLPLEDLLRFISIDGVEHLNAALAKGRGGILLGAHFGPHGYSSMMLFKHLGYPLVPVVTEEINPADSWLYRRMAAIRNEPRSHFQIINPNGAPQRDLVKCLKENKLLYITGDVLDRDLRRLGPPHVMPAPILDRHLPLKTGPFRLARWLGSPVIPCFVVPRPGGGYVVRVEAPLALAAEGSAEGLQADLAAFTARFEPHLLRNPELWAHWRRRRNSLPDLMGLLGLMDPQGVDPPKLALGRNDN